MAGLKASWFRFLHAAQAPRAAVNRAMSRTGPAVNAKSVPVLFGSFHRDGAMRVGCPDAHLHRNENRLCYLLLGDPHRPRGTVCRR